MQSVQYFTVEQSEINKRVVLRPDILFCLTFGVEMLEQALAWIDCKKSAAVSQVENNFLNEL